MRWKIRIDIYTTMYEIINENLLCSLGDSTQCSVLNGKETQKRGEFMYTYN